MIALDSNLLIYAHKQGSPFHTAAAEEVDSLRLQPAAWAIPWPCIHEFIGIVTHPGIYKPASTLSEALGFVDALLASPQLHLLAESPGYFAKLHDLALAAKLSGHHGVSELWSADRDFSAFPQLKVRNPLVKK